MPQGFEEDGDDDDEEDEKTKDSLDASNLKARAESARTVKRTDVTLARVPSLPGMLDEATEGGQRANTPPRRLAPLIISRHNTPPTGDQIKTVIPV